MDSSVPQRHLQAFSAYAILANPIHSQQPSQPSTVSPTLSNSPTIFNPHTLVGYCYKASISLGDVAYCANAVGFQGLVSLLPDFCQLSVP